MAKKFQLYLNVPSVGEFLKSDEMKAYMKGRGDAIARRAGTGYACAVHNSGQRQIAKIYAATAGARSDNLRNNTLLKALR